MTVRSPIIYNQYAIARLSLRQRHHLPLVFRAANMARSVNGLISNSEAKGGSAPNLTFNLDVTTQQLDKAPTDGQSKPTAFLARVSIPGLGKRVKKQGDVR